MRSILNEFIYKFIIERSRKHKILTALFVLAFAVTLGVFLRLKLIGISMTYEPTAGNNGGITNPIETIDNRIGEYYGAGRGFTVNLYKYVADDVTYNQYANNVQIRDHGINIGHALHFLPNGANFSTNNFPTEDNQKMTMEHYTGDSIALQGIVQTQLSDNGHGYPVLTPEAVAAVSTAEKPYSVESLQYLFSDGNAYVTEYPNVTGLFSQSGSWIEYDSNKNYAYFLDGSNNTKGGVNQFGVNATTVYKEDGDAVGFFPFTALDENKHDVNADLGVNGYAHHFGLTMTADFTIYENGQVNGQDMEFKFEGDDDLWVFVDGILVLDIGGIHRPLSGSINFQTGDVIVEDAAQVNGNHTAEEGAYGGPLPTEHAASVKNLEDIINAAYSAGYLEKNYSDLFKVGTTHEMKVFYLERGGVNSNLTIMTNIFERQKVVVKKEWDDKGETVDHSMDKVTYALFKQYRDLGMELEPIPDIEQYMSNPPDTGAGQAPAGVLTKAKGWTEIIDRLPASGDGGRVFDYVVKETSMTPGYVALEPIRQPISMGAMDSGEAAKYYPYVYASEYSLRELTTASSWETTNTDNVGYNTLHFGGQYRQINLAIPEEVRSKKIVGVLVNFEGVNETNYFAIKLLNNSDTQLKVDYGVNRLSADGVDLSQLTRIGFMNTKEGTADFNIRSVTFLTQDEVISSRSYNETEFENIMNINYGTLGLDDQYDQRNFPISDDITIGALRTVRIDIRSSDYNIALKVNPVSNDDIQIVEYNIGSGTRNWNVANHRNVPGRAGEIVTAIGIMDNRANGDRVSNGGHQNYVDITGLTYTWSRSQRIGNPFPKPSNNPGFNIVEYGDRWTLKNERLTTVTVDVTKRWIDLLGVEATPNPGVTVDVTLKRWKTRINAGNELEGPTEFDTDIGTETLTAGSAPPYSCSFTGLLPVETVGGQKYAYTYSIVENGVDDHQKIILDGKEYIVSYSNADPIVSGSIEVTNQLNEVIPQLMSVQIDKKWVSNSGLTLLSRGDITAIITRTRAETSLGSPPDPGDFQPDTTFAPLTVTVPPEGYINGSFPRAEKVGDIVYEYKYYAVESGMVGDKVQLDGLDYQVSIDRQEPTDSETEITITNTDISRYDLPGKTVGEGHKTIDYLFLDNPTTGLGTLTQGNPDTDLRDEGMYRLYLDFMSSLDTAATDLLIVVDQSESMYMKHDMTFGGTSGWYRDQVLSSILNGGTAKENPLLRARRYVTGEESDSNPVATIYDVAANKAQYRNLVSTSTNDSLIRQFLALNEDNRVAVVGFSANRTDYAWDSGHAYPDAEYNYGIDSEKIWDWTGVNDTRAKNPIDVQAYHMSGANYEAGLVQADKLLSAVESDGKRKVMIFISDGAPNSYISDQEGVGGRVGNTTDTTSNIQDCMNPSIDAFTYFISKHKDLTVFSIGISEDMTAGKDQVLKVYTNNGGSYIYVNNDGDELRRQLVKLLLPTRTTNLTITDELSPYVELYGVQPDLKVTMRTEGADDEVVIWRGVGTNGADSVNGMFTPAGANTPESIVSAVIYTPGADSTSTGTVQVVFNSKYAMPQDKIYTLSYNVRTTDLAYNDTYNYVGEADTDYSANGFKNNTSYNQNGFKSNKAARADYEYEYIGEGTHLTYAHPVVQAAINDLTVIKEWLDRDDNPTRPFTTVEVQLYQKVTPGLKKVTTLEPGKYYVFQNADDLTYWIEDPLDPGTTIFDTISQENLKNCVWYYGSDNILRFGGPSGKPPYGRMYGADPNVENSAGKVTVKDTDADASVLTSGYDGYHLWFNNPPNGTAVRAYLALDGGVWNKYGNINIDPSLALNINAYEYQEGEERAYGGPVTLYGSTLTDINLQHTYPDLPAGGYDSTYGVYSNYSYYIVETTADSSLFTTTYSKGTDRGLPEKGRVTVTNKMVIDVNYTLPMTGGGGTAPYAVTGIAVMIAGFILQYRGKRKRERRSEI